MRSSLIKTVGVSVLFGVFGYVVGYVLVMGLYEFSMFLQALCAIGPHLG